MTLGVLGLALVVFLVAYWLTGRLCSPDSSLYLLDHPNERSLHSAPTPRTGGLAIVGSLFVGLMIGVIADQFGVRLWSPTLAERAGTGRWFVAMSLIIGVVSFLDDRANVPVGLKFGVHLVAASGIVWGAGLTAKAIGVPLLGTLQFGWMAAPITIMFVIWITNLYNFMDGMDGFAGGMTAVGFGFLAYFAWRGDHQFIMVVSLLVSVAAAGFLLYNIPPARIFMGDVGSVVLGFMAAALIVMGLHDGMFDLWVPMLIFSPFILDATVTLVRRALRGAKIWQAHREHYYQRLVLAGWGHRKAVLAEYGLMLVCGGAAVVYTPASDPWRLAILAAWTGTFILLARGVRSLERRMVRLREQL